LCFVSPVWFVSIGAVDDFLANLGIVFKLQHAVYLPDYIDAF